MTEYYGLDIMNLLLVKKANCCGVHFTDFIITFHSIFTFARYLVDICVASKVFLQWLIGGLNIKSISPVIYCMCAQTNSFIIGEDNLSQTWQVRNWNKYWNWWNILLSDSAYVYLLANIPPSFRQRPVSVDTDCGLYLFSCWVYFRKKKIIWILSYLGLCRNLNRSLVGDWPLYLLIVNAMATDDLVVRPCSNRIFCLLLQKCYVCKLKWNHCNREINRKMAAKI